MEQLNGELVSDKVDEVLRGLEGEPIDEHQVKKAAKEVKEQVEKIPNFSAIATRRKVEVTYRGIKVIMNVRSYHQEFEYKIYAMVKDPRV
jgi:sulfur relay (sulfurtransferase) DsrC/TusE family protein